MRHELIAYLDWQEAVRSTQQVRAKVQELRKASGVYCLWSGTRLTNRYDVDHCLPSSRWPNNDLWDLFPTRTSVNSNKRDRNPSEVRLRDSKSRILEWWEKAWAIDSRERFYAEARLSLPGLGRTGLSMSDVYDALAMRSIRSAEFQDLQRW